MFHHIIYHIFMEKSGKKAVKETYMVIREGKYGN